MARMHLSIKLTLLYLSTYSLNLSGILVILYVAFPVTKDIFCYIFIYFPNRQIVNGKNHLRYISPTGQYADGAIRQLAKNTLLVPFANKRRNLYNLVSNNIKRTNTYI